MPMKRVGVWVLGVALAFALLSFFSFGQEKPALIDSEVLEALEEKETVSVIVMLEDDYSLVGQQKGLRVASDNQPDEFEQRKIMIEKQQNNVLEDLKKRDTMDVGILSTNDESPSTSDFDLGHQYTTINGFSGEITQEGLEKLTSDPRVKGVYFDWPVHALLAQSKGIVNATSTWRLVYNGTNITGKHQTVCVIDTGIDYTHSDLGACGSTTNINDGSCGKVIGGQDFVNGDYNPMDDNDHGTHVAGIIASTNGTYR